MGVTLDDVGLAHKKTGSKNLVDQNLSLWVSHSRISNLINGNDGGECQVPTLAVGL